MSTKAPPLVDTLAYGLGCSAKEVIHVRRKGEYMKERSLEVSFQRTIRVSDNGSTSALPPGFGAFPLYEVSDYQETDALPAAMKAKGGYFMPMHRTCSCSF
jgi:hypothetical protein